MMYEIAASKKYDESVVIEAGKSFKDNISFDFNDRYNYKLRIRGEVNIPYSRATSTTSSSTATTVSARQTATSSLWPRTHYWKVLRSIHATSVSWRV